MAGRSGDDDDDDIDAAAAARVPTGVATPSTSVDRSRVMFFFEKSAGVQFFAARVRDDERFVSTAATTQQMDGEGSVVSDTRDDEWLVRNENVYQNEPLRQVQSSASSLDTWAYMSTNVFPAQATTNGAACSRVNAKRRRGFQEFPGFVKRTLVCRVASVVS